MPRGAGSTPASALLQRHLIRAHGEHPTAHSRSWFEFGFARNIVARSLEQLHELDVDDLGRLQEDEDARSE